MRRRVSSLFFGAFNPEDFGDGSGRGRVGFSSAH